MELDDNDVIELENEESKTNSFEQSIKSVDVFNALNLYNEELGNSYKNDGYNPFDDDFILTEEYTNYILENKKLNTEVFTESFLEFSNKTVSKHFQNAIENDNTILDNLTQELENATNEKDKKQIKKAIVFLKNRNELLKVNITKLKQKDANAIKMYIEMFGMDNELSELLKDTFNERANNQLIVQNMLNACRFRANRAYLKTQTKFDNLEQSQQNQQQILQNTQNKETTKQADKTEIKTQSSPLPPKHKNIPSIQKEENEITK